MVNVRKIKRTCKGEIIVLTKLTNHTYMKTTFSLTGDFKKEKIVDVNDNRIGSVYRLSTDDAFDYLLNNETYTVFENSIFEVN